MKQPSHECLLTADLCRIDHALPIDGAISSSSTTVIA
jgi:hypothetical protein